MRPPDRVRAGVCNIFDLTVTHVGVMFHRPARGYEGISKIGNGKSRMISCKDVATLIGTGQLPGAPGWRHCRARLHLMMCKHCRRFDQQLRQIGAAARSMQAAFGQEPSAGSIEQKVALRLGLNNRPAQK